MEKNFSLDKGCKNKVSVHLGKDELIVESLSTFCWCKASDLVIPLAEIYAVDAKVREAQVAGRPSQPSTSTTQRSHPSSPYKRLPNGDGDDLGDDGGASPMEALIIHFAQRHGKNHHKWLDKRIDLHHPDPGEQSSVPECLHECRLKKRYMV